MDIPFNLSFYTNTGEVLNVTKFAESHKQLIENSDDFSIEVKENCDLTVLFDGGSSSRTGWRLKIDIMDELPESCFTNEELQSEKEAVFYPSDKRRPLYLDSRSKINGPKNVVYPMLIPGSYKIVVSKEMISYYAFLKIAPLRIDDNQLEVMKDEIESYLKGLSLTMNKNSNMDFYNYKNNNNILYKTNLLLESHSRIISILNRIADNPKYLIKRKYSVNGPSNFGRSDSRTIRYKQKRMDKHDRLLTYKNIINYNIKENRILKFIVYSLIAEIKKCLKFVAENIKRDRLEVLEQRKFFKKEQLEVMRTSMQERLDYNDDIYKKLGMILSTCNKLVGESWMDLIANIKYLQHPSLIARSRDYNLIYKFHLQLKSKVNIDNNPLVNYNYFWKESSKLYEIWGFLKLKAAIIQSEYNLRPTDGWIYDSETEGKSEVIPFLDPDTQITYENGEGLKVKLYYDSILSREEETFPGNPVYTVENNNRPDFRIDIYMNDIYKESIIGDFKYRAYNSLGNIRRYLRGGTSAYRQLLAYSNIRTLYINSQQKKKRSKGAAYEAWVFYPETSDTTKKRESTFDSATNIRRIELSPGKNTNLDYLFYMVRETINNIIEE